MNSAKCLASTPICRTAIQNKKVHLREFPEVHFRYLPKFSSFRVLVPSALRTASTQPV